MDDKKNGSKSKSRRTVRATVPGAVAVDAHSSSVEEPSEPSGPSRNESTSSVDRSAKSKSRRTVPASSPGAVVVEPSEPVRYEGQLSEKKSEKKSKSRRTAPATTPGAVAVEDPSVNEPENVPAGSSGQVPTTSKSRSRRGAKAKSKTRPSSRATAPGAVAVQEEVPEPEGDVTSAEPFGVALTSGARSSSSSSPVGKKSMRNKGAVTPGAVAVAGAGAAMSAASTRKAGKGSDGVGIQVPASRSSRHSSRGGKSSKKTDGSRSTVPGAQNIEGEDSIGQSKSDSERPRVIFEGGESDQDDKKAPGAKELQGEDGISTDKAQPMLLYDDDTGDDIESGRADEPGKPIVSVGLNDTSEAPNLSNRSPEELMALNAPVQLADQYNADIDEDIENRKKREAGRKKCRICIIVTGIIGIIVGVSVGVTAGKGGDDSPSGNEPSSPAPTPPPTAFVDFSACFEAGAADATSPRYTSIREVLRATSTGNIDLMDEVNSPQRKALCWLADFDELELEADQTNSPAILQRYTLAVFYYTLVDESTSLGLVSSNWLSAAHECSWEGLDCTASDVVTGMSLRDQKLAGEVPREIADLSSLETFNHDSNVDLSGPLPSSFWRLSSLRNIVLSLTDITGSLPSPGLGDLANLTQVALESFSGPLPDELYSLTKLITFSNGDVFEGTLSTSIGLLRDLEIFQIRVTGPASIPSEIGLLTALKILDLQRSELSGSTLPPEIGSLANLESLALNECGLEGPIPIELGLLGNLKLLTLQTNPLTGTIPIELGALSNAESIFLRFTELEGMVPTELCALREGVLRTLEADCRSEVVCAQGCCTTCS